MTDLSFQPIFANAIGFAFEKATIEGKITIGVLMLVSLFSWTVIITKFRQLWRANRSSKKFYATYRSSRDPLDIFNRKEEFVGAPAYELYADGATELAYQLKNNPVNVEGRKRTSTSAVLPQAVQDTQTDFLARSTFTKISGQSFDSVKIALERSSGAEALSLEKGMIVLSTAVAGGPFIGLLGTVWGVMETFAGIARANAASLTAMAPGVAGALIATVIGLLVAIPAMFAYNFMVTTIRSITQELDGFATEYATAIEHRYVDSRPLAEEITDALRAAQGERELDASPATPVFAN
jgi:biopolymer transport protein ExbB/TolQ